MSKLQVGSVIRGEVTAIKPFGAFIKLENGQTGLVHISQVSAQYTEKIEDVLKIGQQVNVKILSTDNNNKISLSIKDAVSKTANKSDGHKNAPSKTDKAANFEGMMKKWLKSSEERLSALSTKQGKNK